MGCCTLWQIFNLNLCCGSQRTVQEPVQPVLLTDIWIGPVHILANGYAWRNLQNIRLAGESLLKPDLKQQVNMEGMLVKWQFGTIRMFTIDSHRRTVFELPCRLQRSTALESHFLLLYRDAWMIFLPRSLSEIMADIKSKMHFVWHWRYCTGKDTLTAIAVGWSVMHGPNDKASSKTK